MIRLTLRELARISAGTLHGVDAPWAGADTDTRTLGTGQLFIAVPGERVDGHDFLMQALALGAAGALVQRRVDVALAQVVVNDTVVALGLLARHWLQHLPARRLALTGSNGKTTVKTLLLDILAQHDAAGSWATPGNRNNEIGLPLAALGIGTDIRHAVFEMGAGKPGDIEYLCEIAPPHIGLVNTIAPAHLERLGDLDGVARTKSAVYRSLPADGVGVVNFDDPYAAHFRAELGARRCIGFGLDATTDIGAAHPVMLDTGWQFDLRVAHEVHPVRLGLAGRHNLRNALAAAGMAHAAGVPVATIAAGLSASRGVAGRLQALPGPHGSVLLDDSYNANPGSFAAGLHTLVAQAPRAWVVMGGMAELGADSDTLHRQIGALARELGVERLYTLGPRARAAADAAGSIALAFDDLDTLLADLAAALQPGVQVLIKGSRSAGMERVVQRLRADLRGSEAGGVTQGVSAC